MWFIGVEVEKETSAPPPKKNPGSAPAVYICYLWLNHFKQIQTSHFTGCLFPEFDSTHEVQCLMGLKLCGNWCTLVKIC